MCLYLPASVAISITYAAFYKGKVGNLKKAKTLSYGVNHMGNKNGRTPGIHAEYDAIAKLPTLRKKRRLKSINILVIRITSKNKIQSSKPCSHCIDNMVLLAPKKGYQIKNIYYSNENGGITKTSLHSLQLEERHISRYYRNRNRHMDNSITLTD